MPIAIVSDASAIINLNATQCTEDILRALPERIAVVDIVRGELEDGRGKGHRDAEKLQALASAGLIDIVSLGDIGDAIFEQLVAGSALSTLDDGEAATIAYAVENSASVVIDDQKARRICKERFPGVPRHYSVEILQRTSVVDHLGPTRLIQAVTNALQGARMQVSSEHSEWIISLIGAETARRCSSLPRRLRPNPVAP